MSTKNQPVAVIFNDGTVKSFSDWISGFIAQANRVQIQPAPAPIPEPVTPVAPAPAPVRSRRVNFDRTGNRCEYQGKSYKSVMEASRATGEHRYWIVKYCDQNYRTWKWL